MQCVCLSVCLCTPLTNVSNPFFSLVSSLTSNAGQVMCILDSNAGPKHFYISINVTLFPAWQVTINATKSCFCLSVSLDNKITLFQAESILSTTGLTRLKNEKAGEKKEMKTQHSMVPTVKLLEKLLLTPCPAFCTNNDPFQRHVQKLLNRNVLCTYCSNFTFYLLFYLSSKSCKNHQHIQRQSVSNKQILLCDQFKYIRLHRPKSKQRL